MNGEVRGSWAQEEFDGAKLWDKRCNKSLAKIGMSLEENAGLSFSAACGASLRQSGGEIFSHEEIGIEDLQTGHYQQTIARCKDEKVILVSQDSSYVNYTTHPATEGLGPIDTDGNSLGLVMHTALVLREDGLPLGIIGQKIWARNKAEKVKRQRRKELPIEEKESYKWLEGLKWINERLAPPVQRVCLIQDREADIYEFMSHSRAGNVDILLRATHPRKVEVNVEGELRSMNLLQALGYLKVLGRKKVCIERANKMVEVTLEISAGQVKILAPRRYPGQDQPAALLMSLIYAREIIADPELRYQTTPPGEKKEEPIEWILLYSGQISSFEDAMRCIDYYTQRWKVERFHYTLKSGLKIERLQFDDAVSLGNAIGVYSVVAWRIMWVTYYGRLQPDSPATEVLNEQSCEVLEAATHQKITTAKEVVYAIGKLGGFQGGTRKYREPGLKSMWQGWLRLEAMEEGWRLAHEKFEKIKLQD